MSNPTDAELVQVIAFAVLIAIAAIVGYSIGTAINWLFDHVRIV